MVLNLWYSCIRFPSMTTHATWLYAYVYDTHVCRILHVHTSMCTRVKARRRHRVFYSITLSLVSLRWGIIQNLKLGGCQQAPVSLLSLISIAGGDLKHTNVHAQPFTCVLGSKLKSCIASALTHWAITPVPNFSSTLFNLKRKTKTSMMINYYNPNTWEVETGEWSSRSVSVT